MILHALKKIEKVYMQEKIVEIILHLVTDMRNQNFLDENTINKLVDEGYTQSEISTAFSWLYDKVQLGENLFIAEEQGKDSASHRHFHEAEKQVFTPEARGYLMQCYELGLIDQWDIEFIVDRVMYTGFSRVSINEIKSLIAAAIFDYDDSDKIGSRIMLNPKDTIH
jgi:uncharacterized protein Smg (DUF494 family)